MSGGDNVRSPVQTQSLVVSDSILGLFWCQTNIAYSTSVQLKRSAELQLIRSLIPVHGGGGGGF